MAERRGDEISGEKYYLARVELAEDAPESVDAVRLYPGMQAEVMIVTGERTALEYLMEPLSRSLRRAFREN